MRSTTPLQLYRLSSLSSAASTPSAPPKLTFACTLHGASGPLSALALSDGRCVALGANGGVWVWDLNNKGGPSEFGVEVARPDALEVLAEDGGHVRCAGGEGEEDIKVHTSIGFDERRIVSADVRGIVEVRRFDI
jgi:hypothetical protein